jgi:sugar/nucleoside kinase (ribokinase family)
MISGRIFNHCITKLKTIRIEPHFKAVVGTGGIGTGTIYLLEGNHNLGRNESRRGHLLAVKDFCKLHIIFHYLAILIQDLKINTRIYPVGAIGADAAGSELFEMMKKTGMEMEFVVFIQNTPTLHSVCFLYPDFSGGNITESQSASSKISAGMITGVEKILKKSRSIILAVPEVPLERRIDLINLGFRNHAFIMGSFAVDEIETVMAQDLLIKMNLISVNLEEAAAIAGIPANSTVEKIVNGCIGTTAGINPELKMCITCGSMGIYGYEQGNVEYLPVLEVEARNTAGAGDAVFSGIITGLILGYPFTGPDKRSCLNLGRLISAMSVTSDDTINFNINLRNLMEFQKIHDEEVL